MVCVGGVLWLAHTAPSVYTLVPDRADAALAAGFTLEPAARPSPPIRTGADQL